MVTIERPNTKFILCVSAAVLLVTCTPKTSMSSDQDPELLLLDMYVRLVQGKVINEKCGQSNSPQARELAELVRRTGTLLRGNFGTRQGDQVTQYAVEMGKQRACNAETRALLETIMSEARQALAGHRNPVSEHLRNELERYSRLAGAYYIELKCKHLSRRHRQSFWKLIADLHNSLMYHTLLGTSEAKHIAEGAPDAIDRCNKESRRLVKTAYQELRNK